MPTLALPRNLDELAALGTAIYERSIKPAVQPRDHGSFVAIDVVSEAYVIDQDDYSAVARLQASKPEADIWLMRVGYPATCRIGAVR